MNRSLISVISYPLHVAYLTTRPASVFDPLLIFTTRPNCVCFSESAFDKPGSPPCNGFNEAPGCPGDKRNRVETPRRVRLNRRLSPRASLFPGCWVSGALTFIPGRVYVCRCVRSSALDAKGLHRTRSSHAFQTGLGNDRQSVPLCNRRKMIFTSTNACK